MIETHRLWTRAYHPGDARDCYGFLGDPQMMAFTHCDATLAECENRLTTHERCRNQNGCAPWVIGEKGSSKIIGWGGLYIDPFETGWGTELAYFFDASIWGKGIAREFAQAVCAFNDTRLHRPLESFAHPENTGSIAVLKGCGFEQSGFLTEMNRLHFRRAHPK